MTPPYAGIAEAVRTLAGRDDFVLGIATGKSRRGVARVLDREGWHGHFLTIQTADDHPSKPHPSMILRAMNETGAEPVSTLMVGDTSFDMEMARNANVGAVGVGWGYHETSASCGQGRMPSLRRATHSLLPSRRSWRHRSKAHDGRQPQRTEGIG